MNSQISTTFIKHIHQTENKENIESNYDQHTRISITTIITNMNMNMDMNMNIEIAINGPILFKREYKID